MFITFEGADGAGKTTQIDLLAQYLERLGREVRITREPGGTEAGAELRQVVKRTRQPEQKLTPLAQTLTFCASFAQSCAEIITPALDAGSVVLSDRWVDSTAAYQSAGGGLDEQVVHKLCRVATTMPDGRHVTPDLTFYLRVSPEARAQRIAARGEATDAIEAEGDSYFNRVTAGFDAIAAADPERVKVIDASGSIERVHAAILIELTMWRLAHDPSIEPEARKLVEFLRSDAFAAELAEAGTDPAGS